MTLLLETPDVGAAFLEPEPSDACAVAEYDPARDFPFSLLFHVAKPLEFVVALCDTVPPFGVLTVNVTFAPDAGLPPFVTDAVREAVPGAVKVVLATLSATASAGAVTTVAFALPGSVCRYL